MVPTEQIKNNTELAIAKKLILTAAELEAFRGEYHFEVNMISMRLAYTKIL